MKTIYIERITIDGTERIRLNFRFDQDMIIDLKELPGVKWSPEVKIWHMPNMENPTTYLRKSLHSKYRIAYQEKVYKGRDVMNSQQIYYQEIHSEDRIYLKFDYNSNIIELIKTLDEYYWHGGRKIWSIRGGEKSLRIFIKVMLVNNIKPIAADIYQSKEPKQKLNPYKFGKSELPEKLMNYMVLKNYSERTIRIYKDHILVFLQTLNEDKAKDLTAENITEYVQSVMSKTNYSRSYQNQLINALKLYYRVMQNRKLDSIDLPRPIKDKKYPIVLSRDEIILLIETTFNLKHRTIISLIYGTGIRLAESVNIKINDVDYQRKLIHIRAGKGKKDRIVPLPIFLIDLLEKYLKQYRPIEYLFEGWNTQQYSPRSVQAVMKKALIGANIKKDASVHTLRHSFATHALEDGFNIRLVQEILGHKNIKTTEIYTHISNANILSVQSPIDKLGLESS